MRFQFMVGLLLALGALLSSPGAARAQTPSGSSPQATSAGKPASESPPFRITEQDVNDPPERQLEFEVLTDPVKRGLPRPDAKLLEKKVIATFHCRVPIAEYRISQLESVSSLNRYGEGYLLSSTGHDQRSETPDPAADLAGDVVRRLLEALPEDRRPTLEQLRFLEERPANLTLSYKLLPNGSSHVLTRQFTVFATSEEEARTTVAAILKLLDQGLTRPIQLALLAKRQEQLELADQLGAEIAAQTKQRVEMQQQLDTLAEFPADLLSSLRVEQLQLQAELAGTRTRIETCKKLLTSGELSPATLQQLLILRTNAEVDLAGSEARQQAIDGFIAKVKQTAELQAQLSTLSTQLRRSELKRTNAGTEQQRIESAIKAYGPLQLVGKITIQPLNWAP